MDEMTGPDFRTVTTTVLLAILIVAVGIAGTALAQPSQETFPRITGSDHVVAPGENVTIELTAQDVNSIRVSEIPAEWDIVASDSEGTTATVEETDEGDRVAGWIFGEAVDNRTASITLRVPEDASTAPVRLPVDGEHPDAGRAAATSIVNVHPDAESLAIPSPTANGPYRVVEGDSVSLDPIGSTDPDGNIESTEWVLRDGNGEIENGHYYPPGAITANETASVEFRIADEDGLEATAAAQILVFESQYATETTTTTTTTADDRQTTRDEQSTGTPGWIGGVGTLVLAFLLVVLVYRRRQE